MSDNKLCFGFSGVTKYVDRAGLLPCTVQALSAVANVNSCDSKAQYTYTNEYLVLCQKQLKVRIIDAKQLQNIEGWKQEIKQGVCKFVHMVIQTGICNNRGVAEICILWQIVCNRGRSP